MREEGAGAGAQDNTVQDNPTTTQDNTTQENAAQTAQTAEQSNTAQSTAAHGITLQGTPRKNGRGIPKTYIVRRKETFTTREGMVSTKL